MKIRTIPSIRPARRISKFQGVRPVHVFAALLLVAGGMQSASAELPMLTEKPWMGYFAATKNRAFEFGISAKGELHLVPFDKRGKEMGAYLRIPLIIALEERRPNGKTRTLAILPETLESADKATDELKKVVIRGEVIGGASFEATIEEDRGIVSIGGRVTDPGPNPKFPLVFTVYTRIPYFHGHVEKDTPAELKAFEEKIEDDYIELQWTDRKRHKEMWVNTVDASLPEMNGPGIASVELELVVFKGRKFLMSASPDTKMKISNSRRANDPSATKAAPLYEGALISWSADPEKDPKGEARISYQFK